MGFELQDTAVSTDNQTVNLYDIDLANPAVAHKVTEKLPDRSSTMPKDDSNFAGFRDTKSSGNHHVLDFSAPVQPAQKPPQGEKSAAQGEPAKIARPANKYEAAVAEQVGYLDSEAKFSQYTRDALGRDADKYPPARNDKDGTTTYTIEQVGLTDRGLPQDKQTAEHYKRLVTITVPDQATSLKDCKFAFKDREKIDEKEFYKLVDRAQKRQCDQAGEEGGEHKLLRPEDMVFYTHGIRTGAEAADFQALALQLTQGHAVIDVDWKSTPPREEKLELSDAYKSERKGAAKSYAKMEKALDDTISHIGADHTDMVAFSHGAMFDTKYLQHRKNSHAPLLNEVILTHPDVPTSALPQPGKGGKVDPSSRLYSQVSKHTDVIGSTADLALSGAAYNDSDSNKNDGWLAQMLEKTSKMSLHERIGNGTAISRVLVAGHGGTYVMETIPEDKKDPYNHFINYQGINGLINDLHPVKLLATGDATTENAKVVGVVQR